MDSPSNKQPFSSLSSCSSSFMEPKIEELVDTEEKRAAEALGVDVPRPLESLHATPIPPFLSKTYDLVDDRSLDRVISWGPAGNSFVLWEPIEFAQSILPRHFKHNNLSSFVRQLNTYGFHKVHADRWEFANEGFLRGNKPLLKNINRRRSLQVQQVGLQIGPSVEMVRSNLEGELCILKGEKSTMIQEVSRLQRENLKTMQQMNVLNQRMQSAEQRQKQIVSFFAKVLQNPMFLAQLKQQKQQRVIASTRIKKKFLKQRQPSQSLLSEFSLQLTEEERLDSTVPAAMSGLTGDEYEESKLPDYLLLDTMEELGIQSSRQELVGGSGFSGKEVGPLSLGSDASTCKEDLAVCRTHSSSSSPRDIITGKVFRDAVSPASVSASPDNETAAGFKGKNIINLKSDIESADSEDLVPFCEDDSCEKLFIDAVETDEGDHEIWSAGLEGGESSLFSGHNTSQTVVHDFQELEFPAEPDALLNFNLDIVGEDLEFGKFVHDAFPFEEHEKNASLMEKDQNKFFCSSIIKNSDFDNHY